jgi:hypothetical protein
MTVTTLIEPGTVPTQRGVAPERTLADAVNPEVYSSRNAQTLASIRGVQVDRRESLDSVVRWSLFGREHRAEIAQIWVKARLDPRMDQGQDIKDLLPLLSKHPELLERLHGVATTDRLFGIERSADNAASFEKMRSEFLAQLIRGAVDSRSITQGPGPMCTVTSMLKTLPPEELLRLGCGFALDGVVKTRSGKEMIMRPAFIERAAINSNGDIGNVKCQRPSAGMLMLLDGVIELGVPDVTQQPGAYWGQYTDVWRSLRGAEAACAARDAKIQVNRLTGQATQESGVMTSEMSQMEYLECQLKRSGGERAGGVLIDTLWNHSRPGAGSDTSHGRHMLRAVGVEHRKGATYIVCENPIGDYVDTRKTSAGHAEFFAPGSILGHKDGFWFEMGGNGTVYIRKDVLSQHLQTVLVDYSDKFAYVKGHETEPLKLGTLDKTTPMIIFVNGDDAVEEVILGDGEIVHFSEIRHHIEQERTAKREENEKRYIRRRRKGRRGLEDAEGDDPIPQDELEGAPTGTAEAVSEALKRIGKPKSKG